MVEKPPTYRNGVFCGFWAFVFAEFGVGGEARETTA
jgi:hypothetical protein